MARSARPKIDSDALRPLLPEGREGTAATSPRIIARLRWTVWSPMRAVGGASALSISIFIFLGRQLCNGDVHIAVGHQPLYFLRVGEEVINRCDCDS